MRQLLKNRYRVLQVLSETGGFAQTFLGEVTDMPSRRRCVIKKLRPVTGPEGLNCAQDRFQREAAILERLGDASDEIPKLYAYFVEDQEFYLVQEFVEGPTLRQLVQQGTPLDEKTVAEMIIALLDVLAYIHKQNVIHRDIKPDNVILRGRDNKPVLIDFGIVKEVLRTSGDETLTHSLVAGTPGYVSPEQVAGQAVFASDLYSLGVTAIFLLTGQNPRRLTDSATGKMNWRQHAPRVSDAFAAILDKSTQMYLPDRYQSAAQMSEDLQNAFNVRKRDLEEQLTAEFEEETLVKPCVAPSPDPEPHRRNYTLYLAIAAAVFSLLAVLGSAAVLAKLNVQNRDGNTRVGGKPSPEMPRQSINNATASQTTRRRAPAVPASITPTPAEVAVPGRFPEASTRLLVPSEFVKRSEWDLRIMRNEIFARHGYIFKSADMQNYFVRQRWYHPRHNDVSGLLSDIEASNVKIIKSSE
jgi:serine/threonine-protein kinase